MKPLFIKKNGTVSKVSGIIMNLIPSYTLAEYNALTHKPLLWVRTDEEYAQIPATDVSYGSGSVEDALDDMFTEMTLSVNETIQITEPTNKSLGACPSGYTPLSVYWVRSGGGNVFSVSCYLFGGNVIVSIANEYTQAVTFQGTLHVILRKTS